MKALLTRWLARPAPVMAPTLAFELRLALHTDAGPVREHNEDFIAALDTPRPGTSAGRCTLMALADGMGGHQAGELASRLAVQAALHSFSQPQNDDSQRDNNKSLHNQVVDNQVVHNRIAHNQRDAASTLTHKLHAALAAANAAVYQQAQRGAQWQGMGTTLLLFAPTAQGGYCAWVGDSRLYLWRGSTLSALTRDDTLVCGLLERGLIDAADVAQHPDHSVLTQAVGTHAQIPSPHVLGPFDLQLGDRFLLCSDGVHDVVAPTQLATALQAPTPHAAVHEILQTALRQGADDNLSIGIVDIAPPQAAAPEATAPRRTRHDTEVLP